MKIISPRIILVATVLLLTLTACTTPTSQEDNSIPTPIIATKAEPRTRDYPWMSLARWYQMHSEDLAEAQQGTAELVFLGDSITESWHWGEAQKAVFERYFGEYRSANFGIGGDQTHNLLWRLQNGLKGNLDPKVVVILIGVNNFGLGNHPAADVAQGIQAVIRQAKENYPNAEIILSAILPRDEQPNTDYRQRIQAANAQAAIYAEQQDVSFYDMGPALLNDKGMIEKEIMEDFLHPTPKGLDIYGEKLAPIVKNHMTIAAKNSPELSASDENIQVIGRTATGQSGEKIIGYPGVSFSINLDAQGLSLIASSEGETYWDLFIDDEFVKTLKMPTRAARIQLGEFARSGKHTVRLTNRSETWHGITTFHSFKVQRGSLLSPTPLPKRKLLVIGDSITCGEAVDRAADAQVCEKPLSSWNASASFGMLLGNAMQAQTELACYGGRGVIRTWEGKTNQLNADDFYTLAVATEEKQYPWDNQANPADLILVALGTNDFSPSAGPLPPQKRFISAYKDLVKSLLEDHPAAHIVLTEGPMLSDEQSNGKAKSTLQNYLYKVRERLNSDRVHVLPSKRYAGDRCDAHPTKEQHSAIAKDLLDPLKVISGW